MSIPANNTGGRAQRGCFPLEKLEFEGVQLNAPHNCDSILQSQYGTYLELPKDINTHFQHIDHTLLNAPKTEEALKALFAGVQTSTSTAN